MDFPLSSTPGGITEDHACRASVAAVVEGSLTHSTTRRPVAVFIFVASVTSHASADLSLRFAPHAPVLERLFPVMRLSFPPHPNRYFHRKSMNDLFRVIPS